MYFPWFLLPRPGLSHPFDPGVSGVLTAWVLAFLGLYLHFLPLLYGLTSRCFPQQQPHLHSVGSTSFHCVCTPTEWGVLTSSHGSHSRERPSLPSWAQGAKSSSKQSPPTQALSMSCSDLSPLPTALLPSMIRRRQGHVVAISSIQGKISVPFRSACEYFLLLPTFPLLFSPCYKNNTFTVQNSDVRETLSTERAGTSSACAPEQRPGLSPSSAPRATCGPHAVPPECRPPGAAPPPLYRMCLQNSSTWDQMCKTGARYM